MGSACMVNSFRSSAMSNTVAATTVMLSANGGPIQATLSAIPCRLRPMVRRSCEIRRMRRMAACSACLACCQGGCRFDPSRFFLHSAGDMATGMSDGGLGFIWVVR